MIDVINSLIFKILVNTVCKTVTLIFIFLFYYNNFF